MKHVISSIFFALLSSMTLTAQNLSNANMYYDQGYIDRAIDEIDRLTRQTEKNNPEAWLLMYKIFKKAETTSPYNSFPDDCIYRQYRSISELMKLQGSKGVMEREFGQYYTQIFNKFYSELITIANKSTDNKNFNNALKNFKNALIVYNDIYEYKLDPSSVDTSLTFTTGYIALRAEKYDDTEKYFSILANLNYHRPEHKIIYSWLVKFYILERKNLPLAKETLNKGLLFFPEDKELLELKAYITSTETQD